MKIFLLKQIAQLTKRTVKNMTTIFYKPPIYASFIVAIAAAVLINPVYAGEKLSDAELDSKFIEVQIRQICNVENGSSNKSEDKSAAIKPAKYTCRADDLFVTTIKNDGDKESKPLKAASDLANSDDSNALLAGVIQNIRSFGRAELLGVPSGVANTGNPILFGSERYSYKWAGNLNEIFQPVYAGGVIAPYSIYDYSDLGYGFRQEAHFPYSLPQPSIQAIITHN